MKWANFSAGWASTSEYRSAVRVDTRQDKVRTGGYLAECWFITTFVRFKMVLTSWICNVCTLRLAVRALISFCCCVTAAPSSCTLRCSLRNSQHRVHRLIAHGDNFPLVIASDQIGVDLFHLLGHQPKLRDALGVK